MILRCDSCATGDHGGCKRWVRAFIDKDGPDNYACECYCNQRRREREDAESKVKEVLSAYQRRYGREACAAIVASYAVAGADEKEARDG